MLKINLYDDLTDPINHPQKYITFIRLERTFNAIMCKAFSFTLTGVIASWVSTNWGHHFALFRDLS